MELRHLVNMEQDILYGSDLTATTMFEQEPSLFSYI